MKINWKLRLQNKTTLVAIIAGLVALVYQILGWFGVAPQVSHDEILSAAATLINVLVLLGIVVDPTTNGLSDSDRAMNYDEPNRG